MSSIEIAYASSSALTISLASLASSATWVAGRESTSTSNTTNLYLDYLLAGKITVGTTPTISTQIRIYSIAPLDDTPTWPDVFAGTDAARTVTSAGVRDGFAKILASINVDATTSNRVYFFGPISIASMYGGSLPKNFSIYVTHNTGVALNATGGNHVISITPVSATVA